MNRRSAGFTLMELVVATTLLAAALALAFTTVRASTATAQRAEEMAARNERMRAVEGFLRRRIASALPVAFGVDTQSGGGIRFIGEPDRMRFVADLPPYLGRGGPHLHDIRVTEEDDGLRLEAAFAVVLAAEVQEEDDPRPPELLAGGLQEVRLAYRGLDARNQLGEWEDTWEQGDRMPLQVRIEVVDGRGDAWPTMIVTLPQAAAFSGGGVPF